MTRKREPVLVVMDRGFVLFGFIDGRHTAQWRTLRNCYVVRIWGTTKGLGELALKGPLPSTVLDRDGDVVRCNSNFFLRIIPCDNKAWAAFADGAA
jgi:hypothetical protein